MAVEHGIRPTLVLLWCNHIPGTWGSKVSEKLGAPLLPFEEVRTHVERVVGHPFGCHGRTHLWSSRRVELADRREQGLGPRRGF